MKFDCRCGATIVDQTDDLPHKAHLIPDQDWSALFDAIDREALVPLAAQRIGEPEASMRVRTLLIRAVRLAYQCQGCGRLYVDDRNRELQCYAPEDVRTEKEVLRARP